MQRLAGLQKLLYVSVFAANKIAQGSFDQMD